MENITITNREMLIGEIIKNISDDNTFLYVLNSEISDYLSNDINFIKFMIKNNIENVKYINFSILTDNKKEEIINYFTDCLKDTKFNIMNYSFRDIFLSNYKFMDYLINQDLRWIAVTLVNDKQSISNLVKLFLKKVSDVGYKFKIKDFLFDGEYINHRLIENNLMLKYFFKNSSEIPKYINFLDLENGKLVGDAIVKEMSVKDYEFCNEYFLVNGKYPLILSSSFIFMKYVIDKNFNNLAFIDDKYVPLKDLKKIINYAFRMVYYIRGNNRKLSFDMEGYFKNSTIKDNPYFIECMNSL